MHRLHYARSLRLVAKRCRLAMTMAVRFAQRSPPRPEQRRREPLVHRPRPRSVAVVTTEHRAATRNMAATTSLFTSTL